MAMDLKGKRVVVTGASSGIGRAAAKLFAAEGAEVALLARRADALNGLAREIEADGGVARAFAADLSVADEVEAVAARVLGEAGAPHVLVNNAGAGQWKPLLETSPDEARRMIEVPYLAAFYATRLFLPSMIAQGDGRIAVVTSPGSHIVWPRACGYIAARHALKGFAEALRADLRGADVGVSLITLGSVASSYWSNNPGSRANLPPSIPWLMPELTETQAAETIVAAVAKERSRVVRPWFYRTLIAFGLNA